MSLSSLNTFRAFSNRNYSLFFTGQSLSLIGTWMQRTGVSWVVYSLTSSPFMLGLTIFASQFPSFIFSLYGGVLSDRYSRVRILYFTQIASLVQALLLAILTVTDSIHVAGILVISAFLGIINAFDVPARQPLVHEMVNRREDLPNALALNSAMVNLARLVGPALSGLVLHYWGASTCFFINAFSFLCVIGSLMMMRFKPFVAPVRNRNAYAELREGVMYLVRTPSLLAVLTMITCVSLFVLPYDALIPVFAKNVFHGNASTFGTISSFIGLGAISCTLYLASLKPGANLKVILMINTLVLGAGLILFSHCDIFWLAMVFAVLTGFGALSQTTIIITIIQIETESQMRGRVMSFMAMCFFGMLPLGSLLIGTVSEHLGSRNTLLCQGILAFIIAAVFSRHVKRDRLKSKDEMKLLEAENQVSQEIQ